MSEVTATPRIATIVIDVVADEADQPVTAQTRIDELGLDSLELLEAILRVQEKTGRKISDEQLAKLETVADLIAAVESAA